MIITCPNCTTRYSVDPATLGSAGKAVRCSNCGNTWRQGPVQAPSPPKAHRRPAASRVPPQPVPMAYAQPAPQPMAPQPGQMAYGQPAPQPGQMAYAQPVPQAGQMMAPQPAPVAAPPPPPPPEPPPEPKPEPEPKPKPEPEPEPEPKPKPEPKPEPEPEPLPPAEEEGEPLSQEELDSMFEDEEEPEPITSMITDGEEDGEIEAIGPDDIPEPEPLPVSLTATEYEEGEEPEGRPGLQILVLVVIAVLIIGGFVGGLYFARGPIASMWPAAAKIYAMAGISVTTLGEGLVIRGVKQDRVVEDNVDVVKVRGIVANVSDMLREVPMIRVTLYDSEGEEIQYVVVPPQKGELPPGKRSNFNARIEDPSPLARRVEVTFTREEEGAGDAEAPAEGGEPEQPTD